MIIGVTPNGITTLTPEDGMAITNGETITDSMVFLGANSSPDEWHDCPLPVPEDEANEGDYLNALNLLGVRL